MRAGQLHHRLTFYSPVYVKNITGEKVVQWLKVATVQGSIRPLYSTEVTQARAAASQQTHRLETRDGSWISGYSNSWRVVFKNRVFELEGVMSPDERMQRSLIWKAVETAELLSSILLSAGGVDTIAAEDGVGGLLGA